MSIALPPPTENTSRKACEVTNEADPMNNPWFEAIKTGSLYKVRDLMQQGEDIRQVNENG